MTHHEVIHELTSPTEDEKPGFVMPAWIAGIQARRDAFVGADLRVRRPTGDHIGSPLQDIHVDLNSSPPCWNDRIEGRCFKLSETPFSDIFKGGHEDHEAKKINKVFSELRVLRLQPIRLLV